MRLLFDLDRKDYEQCTHTYIRNSARSIIISSGQVAMVQSLKYDYYKFPGGGIRDGENPIDAMIRETMEEAGPKDSVMLEREARVLEMLIAEGLFGEER